MEAVSLNGYAAQGSITVNGETLTKRCGFNADGCLSLQNAKRNVLKGLANKVRYRLDATEGFTWWPKLTSVEQKKWLDKILNHPASHKIVYGHIPLFPFAEGREKS